MPSGKVTPVGEGTGWCVGEIDDMRAPGTAPASVAPTTLGIEDWYHGCHIAGAVAGEQCLPFIAAVVNPG